MTIVKLSISLALTCVALTLSPFAQAGLQEPIPLGEVPPELLEKVQALFPDASFTTANTETESDGTVVYELQGRLTDGRKIEVDLFADGSIEEYEIEFTESQVPGAVLKGVQNQAPGFQPTYIEASYSPSGKVTKYEFVGTLGNKELDLEASADGRKVEAADQ